jgi:hypothetical protein
MKNSENSHPLPDGAVLNEELEFLRDERGPSGKSYNLYLSEISRSPVVHSLSTGKYFVLPWSRIIELAADAGVDAWS